MTDGPTARLVSLGLTLPPPPEPKGTYRSVVVDGHHAWVAGQIVSAGGRPVHAGVVGRDVDVPAAKEVAEKAALQALSALAKELGTLDRIERVVRVAVYLAATPEFTQHSEVANGATELLVRVFGEDAGKPARVSMGVASLPLGAPVEVELVARLR
jgi:enamine deaminase RidA (YjgF/YER057c/UK114 family)